MKNEYEKFNLNIVLIILLFILEGIFFITLFNVKISTYKLFDGIVINDNLVEIIVSSDDLELFNNSHYFYYNNAKVKFKIEQVDRNIIKGYHSVVISCTSKKSVNEIFRFSLFRKKVNTVSMFKIIWKGDF